MTIITFSIPLKLLAISIVLFMILMVSKGFYNFKEKRKLMKVQIISESINSSIKKPIYNNILVNPEIMSFQSLCIIFFGMFLMLPAFNLFVYSDGFTEFTEFHYHLIDQLPPFIYSIIVPLGLYSKNRDLRNFVVDMYKNFFLDLFHQ